MKLDAGFLLKLKQLAATLQRKPWFVQEAKGSKWRDRALTYFVTAVPPEHECWKNDMASYRNLGLWTDEGVTSEEIASFIAAANPGIVDALVEELIELRAQHETMRANYRRLQDDYHRLSDSCSGFLED